MDLGELRADEESIRQKLMVVRARLAEAITALHDAASAEKEIAPGAAPKTSAYRAAAEERTKDRQDRIAAGTPARTEREQLRRDESDLLEQLERNRLAMENVGIKRIVLPMLERIPNAARCAMRWDDMEGDGDTRRCSRCKKSVRNVALLSDADTANFPAPDPIAAFHRRVDGTIILGQCGAEQSSGRWLTVGTASAIFALVSLGALVFLYSGDRTATTRTVPSTPYPSMGLEETLPVVDAIPAPVPIALANVTKIKIFDARQSVKDHHDVAVQLVPVGHELSYEITCNPKSHVSGSIPTARLSAFVAAVNKRKMSQALPFVACESTEDQTQIRVDLTSSEKVFSLSVRNCSHQWLGDGVPLDDDAPLTNADAGLLNHAEVNQRYQELIRAVDLRQCKQLTDWAAAHTVSPEVR